MPSCFSDVSWPLIFPLPAIINQCRAVQWDDVDAILQFFVQERDKFSVAFDTRSLRMCPQITTAQLCLRQTEQRLPKLEMKKKKEKRKVE